MRIKYVFFKKPTDIFIAIGKRRTYITPIYKRLDITQSHLTRTINAFIEEGLVKKEKVGRKCFITLTEKGKSLHKYLKEIYLLFKDSKE